MTSARTRLLLVALLFAVVNLGPVNALLDGGLDGQQLVSVVVMNLALLLGVGLFLLLRGRTRPELRMVATRDLVPTREEDALERVQGNDYVVRGRVAEVREGELLLQVVDRRVRVLLEGRSVPVAEQQAVEVRGTMVG